ncbi:MAG: hypothetical protein ABIN79_13990 [Marmoricola sp.]
MPRLIDYGARFELAREAVLAVTLRDGAAAVNMQTVSRELGVSVATVRRFVSNAQGLPQLGLGFIERRRMVRRFTGGGVAALRDPPLQRLMAAVRLELPLTEGQLAQDRAWEALVAANSGPTIDKFVEDQQAEWQHLAGAVIVALGVPEAQRPLEVATLIALMNGLLVQLVSAEITPGIAIAVIDPHLFDLAAHRSDGVA